MEESKEKKAIIAHYEKIRQQMKENGTYDPSLAYRNGLGGPDLGSYKAKPAKKKESGFFYNLSGMDYKLSWQK